MSVVNGPYQAIEVDTIPLPIMKMDKVMSYVLIDDAGQAAENRIWITQPDFLELFPETWNDSQKKYVSVANKVYQVGIKAGLAQGMIGIHSIQERSFLSGPRSSQHSRLISLNTFDSRLTPVFQITKLPFEIELYAANPREIPNVHVIVELEGLRQEIKRLFSEQVFKEGQSFLLDHRGYYYKITVGHLEFSNEPAPGCIAYTLFRPHYGKLTGRTQIDFTPAHPNEISISKASVDRKIEAFYFSLVLERNPTVDEEDCDPFPPVIDLDVLRSQIRNKFGGLKVSSGHRERFNVSGGWMVIAEFKRVKYENTRVVWVDESHYVKTYSFDPQSKLHVRWKASELTVTTGKPLIPIKIELEIEGYSKTERDQELIPYRKNWISVEEVKQKLVALDRVVIRNEKFHLLLSSGEVVVRATKIKVPEGGRDDKREKVKNTWIIDEQVPITVTTARRFHAELVQSKKAYPLKKVIISVENFSKSPFQKGKDLMMTNKELMEALEPFMKKKVMVGQEVEIEVGADRVAVSIEALEFEADEPHDYKRLGRMTNDTQLEFKYEKGVTVLKEVKPIKIDDPIKALEELGVGGLSKQMEKIVEMIFRAREPGLREEMERRGMTPEKGILLYGPPGTGKTATARAIAEMLEGEEVKLIKGPELFNKWVGQSEENVRKLFEPAEAAAKKLGKKSPLFVLIFDEAESLFRARGESPGNSVRDSVTNQLLAMLDGLTQMDNLLVILMTNRKDMIDPAVLRPGRVGLHLEVGIPNAKARKKIFEIHLKLLGEAQVIGEDVDLDVLVSRTKDWVGAHLMGVVKRANAYSVERIAGEEGDLSKNPKGIITQDDFLRAIEETAKDRQEELSEAAQSMFC